MPDPKGNSVKENYNITSHKNQTSPSQATVEAFAALFRGRTDAHGQVNECVYEPVTLEHYEKHLRGEVNLGVYFLLDDSTCYFAAIDLDERDFNKAKAIRDELAKNSIPAYITASKKKGFHIYCFALEKFKAVEIRRVLNHLLDKLNIKAEIFPKQDYHQPDSSPSEKYPEGEKHPGSYINLPCFGYTRPFLSGELKEVPLEVALERIKHVPQEAVGRILRTLPKEKAKPLPREEVEALDDEVAVGKLLENCAFMQHCKDNATTLSEPWWWSMVHNLAVFGEPGKKKIHELSQPYPSYSEGETEQKIAEALKAAEQEIGPHTCLFIEQGLGFTCPKDCQAKTLKVKAPAGLASILARARKTEEPDLEPSVTPLSPAPSIEQVREVVQRNFPESEAIWIATDATLSVCGSLALIDLSHPLALNLQDLPSSWKTTVLDFYAVKGITYHSDHFTPKAFVTHAANVKKEKLAEIDLLPRIKNKVLIVPELAPLFGVRKEDLLDNISILTRVFDGQGLITDSGAQGRRGYSGEYLFGWLGATTPLSDSIWYLLGKLGSRWLFLSMDSDTLTEKQLVDMMASESSYAEKVAECRLVVSSFIADLFQRHPVKSVKWNRKADPRELLGVIARLADLVRRLRGTIATWGNEGDHTPPIIEYPPRLTMLLYDLARGHAIVHDHRQLAREDIDLVARVALSSMPDARRRVFYRLMEEEVLETKDVMEELSVTRPTALKIMRTLGALGAVSIREEKEDETTTRVEISLLPQDQWLLAKDFDFLTHTQRQNALQSKPTIEDGGIKENDAVYVGNELHLPDGRVVSWEWCLSIWHKIGRPVVHAGDGDNIFDLSLILYPEKLPANRLAGIVAWLEDHSKGKMPPKADGVAQGK